MDAKSGSPKPEANLATDAVKTFGAPGKPRPGSLRALLPRPSLRSFTKVIQNKKALHRKAEGYTDHFGASPSHRSWSPLGRDSARATHTNMYIRNGRLEQDTSTSLRIGHFYFAVTKPWQKPIRPVTTLCYSAPLCYTAQSCATL